MITLRFHLTSPFSGEMGFSGVPLRAAFLNLLKEYDDELSGNVHNTNGVRAYSLDPFPCDRLFNTHFEEGCDYDFGVHLFKPSAFQKLIRKIALRGNHRFRLHHHNFHMSRIDFQKRKPPDLMKEWTRFLQNMDRGPVRIRVDFLTPTQLSSYGSDKAFLLPTPEKVFTGLLRVWNTMENATRLEQTGEYYDWISENVYISGHYLRTVKVPLGRKRSVLGFVGNVVYNIDLSESPLVNLTVGLAQYAEICNIGKNRSAGFGKVGVQVLNRTEEDSS